MNSTLTLDPAKIAEAQAGSEFIQAKFERARAISREQRVFADIVCQMSTTTYQAKRDFLGGKITLMQYLEQRARA